jgi:hypothetical protein
MDMNAKVFPKTKYDSLKDETDYNCQGSCTCKFLKNRTEFDKAQFVAFEKNKKFIYPNSQPVKDPNSRGWLS